MSTDEHGPDAGPLTTSADDPERASSPGRVPDLPADPHPDSEAAVHRRIGGRAPEAAARPKRDANWEERLARARAEREKVLAARGSGKTPPDDRIADLAGHAAAAGMAAGVQGDASIRELMDRPKPWEVGPRTPSADLGGSTGEGAPSPSGEEPAARPPGAEPLLLEDAVVPSGPAQEAGGPGEAPNRMGTLAAAAAARRVRRTAELQSRPRAGRGLSAAGVAGIGLGLLVGLAGGLALDRFVDPNEADASARSETAAMVAPAPTTAPDVAAPEPGPDNPAGREAPRAAASGTSPAGTGGPVVEIAATETATAAAVAVEPEAAEISPAGEGGAEQGPAGPPDAPQPVLAAAPSVLPAPPPAAAVLRGGPRALVAGRGDGAAGESPVGGPAATLIPATAPAEPEGAPRIDDGVARLPAEPGPQLVSSGRMAPGLPAWPDGAGLVRPTSMRADPGRSGSARARPVPRPRAKVQAAAARLGAPGPLRPDQAETPFEPGADAAVPSLAMGGPRIGGPSPSMSGPGSWPVTEAPAVRTPDGPAAAVVPVSAGLPLAAKSEPPIPDAAPEARPWIAPVLSEIPPPASLADAPEVTLAASPGTGRTAGGAGRPEGRMPGELAALAAPTDLRPAEGAAPALLERLPSRADRPVPSAFVVGGAEADLARLEAGGIAVEVAAEAAFPPTRREVRFFHAADAALAESVADELGAELRDFSSFRPAPPEGRIEVLLPAR